MKGTLASSKAPQPQIFLCYTGFDLVGQEDAGRPLIEMAPQLIKFQQEVERQGLNIPFLFHAGETLGDGESEIPN